MDFSSSSAPDFYGFLDRMRRPAAADLIRSIKSFIVSFSLNATDAEEDSKKVQEYLFTMEATIKDHPLWINASYEEIDNAIEGLEKFIMTKLFNRTFASSPEDSKIDSDISEKIRLLQCFIKPNHLDVPRLLRNEASWLLAVKELQKINAYKAPREKLTCIMNCCQVINNLLLNASESVHHAPAGADEFLPALIYITIKANPPQLHSNLKFVQLFRRETKLVSEIEYYLTNLISAKTFILNINAHSLTMEEDEFEKHMRDAKLAIEQSTTDSRPQMLDSDAVGSRRKGKEIIAEEARYPYLDANPEELTSEDVKILLGTYKQLVNRYTSLSAALRRLSLDEDRLLSSSYSLSPMGDPPFRETK
ncbi:hypothetical protein LUZ61_012934 [Rhynchospora tenuis]|uniref:VPS9 domain-containing protein n=1 Tax=Rhynchospora tenuis TaxID=198213 RepID=A0AAD6A421_9POAL|nr:hypothetical protein LUZ61_012934 [Rhynchospora tenuis]